MKKLRIKLNKRGVSPIIATLLLVAIAVAAAVVTYTWTMSMAQNQSTQSQTSVRIDQVLFGRTAASAEVTTVDSVTSTTVFVVDAGGGALLAEGDVVKIYEGTTVYGIRTIVTVATDTITVNEAIGNGFNDGAPKGGVDASIATLDDGELILIRNTGSIASTIETAYIYRGDNLISSTTGITLDVVLSPGADSKIGISTVGTWSNLKSGGLSLPTQDGIIIDAYLTEPLVENTPYRIRLITSTGFIVEGTYYTPGSFSS